MWSTARVALLAVLAALVNGCAGSGDARVENAVPNRPLFSSSVAFGPEQEAVVRRDQKRISDGGSGAGALLFDLATDPLERVPADPDAGHELASLLTAYRQIRAPAAEPAVPKPEQLEQLHSLGYLEGVRVE